MMKLGYNTAGTEAVFEQMLDQQLKWFKNLFGDEDDPQDGRFNYLEIGIAEGTTLISVSDKLRSEGRRWNVFGIDLIDGPFFDHNKFARDRHEHLVGVSYINEYPYVIENDSRHGGISIILSPNGTRDILKIERPIHFSLIDGCHGAPCVEHDFLKVEPAIVTGGIVAFHDAMPEDQGHGWQEHCKMNISVLYALEKLGLVVVNATGMPGQLSCERSGWQLVGMVSGDKSANPLGNGFMFFKKI